MKCTAPLLPALLASTLLASTAIAEIKLPGIFSDHMVLQADRELKIWGTANPNDSLTVQINDAKATAKADANGHFTVTLPPLKPSTEPTELTLSNANAEKIQITDVLIGQVWLGSGQSNMAFSVERSSTAKQTIADANRPQIRLYTVPRKPSNTPVDDNPGKWVLCSPDTIPGFSAVLYHFGLTLHNALHQPVGLIHSSWGGTPIQTWTPRQGFTDREFKAEQAKIDRVYNTPASAPASSPASQKPKPKNAHLLPTTLYNGMIHPIAGYNLAGVVWYQGENNVHQDDSGQYLERFRTMTSLWRKAWSDDTLPFYSAQLAPYGNYRSKNPQSLPLMWEQQVMITRDIPNTYLAPTMDVGDARDIHPKVKDPVGQRLAQLALAHTYHQDSATQQAPTYASYSVEGDTLRIHFAGAPAGLTTADHQPPTAFEIAGADGHFVPAQAKIDGTDVLLSSDQVKNPTSARYAWSATPTTNLQSTNGWPALPFRTPK